jgi:hypothetical protein
MQRDLVNQIMGVTGLGALFLGWRHKAFFHATRVIKLIAIPIVDANEPGILRYSFWENSVLTI